MVYTEINLYANFETLLNILNYAKEMLNLYNIFHETALTTLNMEHLDKWRIELFYSFGLKCTKSYQQKWMFPINQIRCHNMWKLKTYLEPTCKTSDATSIFNSPVPYLTRLLKERKG